MYRALDTLRKHFDDDWDKMHQSLGTTELKTKSLLATYANKIRHGKSLNLQELFDAYLGHYDALKYVRNALLTFLTNNSQPDINLQLPNLGRAVIPNITANPDKNK